MRLRRKSKLLPIVLTGRVIISSLGFFMSEGAVILDSPAIGRALRRIAHEIAERNPQRANLILVGIQTGGVHLALRLSQILEEILGGAILTGYLDVNMHRDDLGQHATPEVHPTSIPFDITNKTVVLIDDVLCSGRTTRAAMDALTALGRPKSIQLAVLIDRGHRELPIRPDFVGKNVPTAPTQRVEVLLREKAGEDMVYLKQV